MRTLYSAVIPCTNGRLLMTSVACSSLTGLTVRFLNGVPPVTKLWKAARARSPLCSHEPCRTDLQYDYARDRKARYMMRLGSRHCPCLTCSASCQGLVMMKLRGLRPYS